MVAATSSATGGAFDLSFSLIEAPGDAQFVEMPTGSNIFGLDPQLGPLANNGGPTETHLPSISSPVVDQGSAPGNLTTDQRGEARTVDTRVPPTPTTEPTSALWSCPRPGRTGPDRPGRHRRPRPRSER